MTFLESYSNDALGPIQKDEAVFLYGLMLALRPRRVLEFGSYFGHSTKCFIEAGVETVVAVDCRVTQELRQLQLSAKPGQLHILEMDQGMLKVDIFRKMFPFPQVDFIFFDAAHDCALNEKTFRNIRELLASGGMLAVHDTGMWQREHMKPEHLCFHGGEWVEPDLYAHQPGEINFARFLVETWGAKRIDIHSVNTLRHGMSLFQF